MHEIWYFRYKSSFEVPRGRPHVIVDQDDLDWLVLAGLMAEEIDRKDARSSG